MAKSKTGSSNIKISGNAVIGEKVYSAKDKDGRNDVIFGSVYGGGYTVGYGTQTLGSTNIEISGNAVVNGIVIGGSHAGPSGNAYVGDSNSSDFSQVVSSVSVSGNVEIRGGYVFGGAYASAGTGENSSDIYGSTRVVVNGGKIFNEAENAGFVFGGGYASDGWGLSETQISKSTVYGNTNVEVNGGSVSNVYGGMYVNEANGYGGACGVVKGDTNVVVSGGDVSNVFGGGMVERATGAENLSLSSTVEGNSNVVISSFVSGDVYGGGNGADSVVKGNSNITLTGNASIGGTLYGGGANGGVVEGTKSLNIGASESAYNGSGSLNVSGFNKINVANGKVEFASYTQAADGTLITISKSGSLAASVNAASQFSETSIENSGELVLKRGSLADNTSASLKSYTGNGSVKAFGGTFANGTFTAGKSESFVSSAITVGTGANDVQSVKFSDKLSLDFDVAGLSDAALTVNSIKASSDLGGIQGDVLAAFDIDLSDNGNEYSVVFSAYIGAIEDASKLVAWHKGADGIWTKLDTAIDYADEIASITVDGFSSYAFSQVPEPATYAAIFGALALAFAAYRKRK